QTCALPIWPAPRGGRRRLLGSDVQVQTRSRASVDRPHIRVRRRKTFCRPQELRAPRGADARLLRVAHGKRLRIQEPERSAQLQLRKIVRVTRAGVRGRKSEVSAEPLGFGGYSDFRPPTSQ